MILMKYEHKDEAKNQYTDDRTKSSPWYNALCYSWGFRNLWSEFGHCGGCDNLQHWCCWYAVLRQS